MASLADALVGQPQGPPPSNGFSWDKVPGAIAQIPGQIANFLLNTAALPGDVYAGRTQVMDPETGYPTPEVIQRAANLGGAVYTDAAAYANGLKGAVRAGEPAA